MSGRVVPYQCPYCGEEDLRPYEPEGDEDAMSGAWHCRGCTRVFTLKYHGMAAPRAMAAPPSPSATDPHHPGGHQPPDPEPE